MTGDKLDWFAVVVLTPTFFTSCMLKIKHFSDDNNFSVNNK